MPDKVDLEQIIRGLEAGIRTELSEIVADLQGLHAESIDDELLMALDHAVCSARCRLEKAKNGG